MVDENYGFCPHCGENLKSDAIYCPGCGAILNQEAAMASRHNVSGMGKSPMRGTFLVAFVLLVMYAILELISSASCFMFNESMYDMMDQAMIDMFGMNFADYMKEYAGLIITKEEFLSNMLTMGIFGVLSALLAGISAFFCYKREKFKVAVGACVLSAIAVMVGSALSPAVAGVGSGVFNLIFGLIVAFMIYSSKKYFKN